MLVSLRGDETTPLGEKIKPQFFLPWLSLADANKKNYSAQAIWLAFEKKIIFPTLLSGAFNTNPV